MEQRCPGVSVSFFVFCCWTSAAGMQTSSVLQSSVLSCIVVLPTCRMTQWQAMVADFSGDPYDTDKVGFCELVPYCV